MKRLGSFTVVLGFLVVIFACGGGDSPEAVMNDFYNCFEGYISAMEGANNADDVVAAINKFSDKMKALAPRMKAIREKYPDFNPMGQGGKTPAEFKEFGEKMKSLLPKMMGLGAKMMQYAKDPKVMEAQKKFQEAMTALK